MVKVVACWNSDRIVFCKRLSVSMSIAAVASSSTNMVEFDKSARPEINFDAFYEILSNEAPSGPLLPKQTNCL